MRSVGFVREWNSDEEFLRYLNGLPPKKDTPDSSALSLD